MSDAPVDPMPDHKLPHEEEEESIEDAVNRVKSNSEGRRPRGWLEHDVKQVCDKFVTGEIKLEGDPPLTPHRVSRLVKEFDGLDEAPSSGAVAAVFDRWEDIGFAIFSKNPRAFTDYTEEGQTRGLAALKAQRTEAKKLEREKKNAESKG